MGLGVLAHTFFDADEARRLVTDYRATFEHECIPIGHAVNPNVATMVPFFCSRDEPACEAALEAFGFLTFAVRHYYSFGRHVPGRTNVWERFEAVRSELGGSIPWRGAHAVGAPEHVASYLRALEDAGVDQVILSHQAGTMRHDQICTSLELFAREVLPGFAGREVGRPDVSVRLSDDAMEQRSGGAGADIPVVEAYGRSRPDPDPSSFPAQMREQLVELQRVKEIAMRLDA
jgi:hypothetical protein